MASLSARGLVPMSAAIAGKEVAITVESTFSMKSATATISGTIRSRIRARGGGAGEGDFCKRAFQSVLWTLHKESSSTTRKEVIQCLIIIGRGQYRRAGSLPRSRLRSPERGLLLSGLIPVSIMEGPPHGRPFALWA